MAPPRILLLALALLAVPGGDRAAADEAFSAGQWTEAAALYEGCNAKDDSDPLAWLRLALARLELGDAAAARGALARVEGIEGRSARVEFASGRVGLVLGEFEAAAKAFAAVRAKDPAFERAWTAQNLGYALHRLGRFEEARAAYRETLARPAAELGARMFVNAAKNELALDAAAPACQILARGREAFPADPFLADTHGWALSLAGDGKAAGDAYAKARELAAARRTPASPMVVTLPMAGTLRVIQGRLGAFSHGSLRNAEAVDLVLLDGKGREWSGDGKRNEDHACFDRPVLAVMDGEVAAVEDRVADNRPGERNPVAPRGNFVYLRHGPGSYSRYFHLECGSVAVRAGTRVKRGDVLGRCGNSGFSTRPHLCFGMADGPPEEDVAVEFLFGPCVVRKDGRDRVVESAAPVEGSVLASPK